MTGVELQNYLLSSGIFKADNCYTIESYDGEKYHKVPSNYKCQVPMIGKIEVTIYNASRSSNVVSPKHEDCERWVDFIIGGVNLYATHKLKDLDFFQLHKELEKVLSGSTKIEKMFYKWSQIELRNHKIENLLI